MDAPQMKPKSFWKRPEGVTGLLFLVAILAVVGFVLVNFGAAILSFISTTIGLVVAGLIVAGLLYMVFDPRMRNLVFYMYKSVMRAITSMFVQIDPIGILKTYVEELQGNLRKMNKQISQLRAQMHKLKEQIVNNERDIRSNLQIAGKAKESNKRNVMILKSRRAGRLK
ncbi:MAG: hypothetical protein WA952_13120, partial [Lewinella sp.]